MTERLRSIVEAGDKALGARTVSFSPAMIEVYADIGLDFVWLDFEHMGPSPYDSTVFEHLTRTAETAGIDLLVRLPSSDPHLIWKVLDTNVRSLLIPRIESVAEVRRAMEATRYTYDGEPGNRGAGSGRSNNWGSAGENYPSREDSSVLVGCMIENRQAVQNIDEILNVPELGFAYVGPSDLSISMGHPYKKNHPEVVEAIETIRERCHAHSVPIGRNTGSTSDATEAITDGYQLLRIGDDASTVRQVLGKRVDELN